MEKQILTEKEKEYLSCIIKPFRDRIRTICKISYDDCIQIVYSVNSISSRHKDDYCSLPRFDESMMYIGMQPNKQYTLEELGL